MGSRYREKMFDRTRKMVRIKDYIFEKLLSLNIIAVLIVKIINRNFWTKASTLTHLFIH